MLMIWWDYFYNKNYKKYNFRGKNNIFLSIYTHQKIYSISCNIFEKIIQKIICLITQCEIGGRHFKYDIWVIGGMIVKSFDNLPSDAIIC